MNAVNQLVCDQCERTFRNEHGLMVHRRLAHGLMPDGSKRPLRKRRSDSATMRKVKKRPYTKRHPKFFNDNTIQVKAEPVETMAAKDHANWCPHCGINLVGVNMAMKMTSH